VCLDADADCIAKPCGHLCCAKCWKALFDQGNKMCPYCRRRVQSYNPIRTAVMTDLLSDPSDPLRKDLQDLAEQEVEKTRENIASNQDIQNTYFGTSTKLNELMRLVRRDIENGEKCVVVSQWTRLLDLVELELMKNDPPINFSRLDGKLPPLKRANVVSEFQENSEIIVCLLSLHAGAEGITLTAATRVYHLDPWWTPARSTQASDRVHRIGQNKDVVITHIHVTDTIEDSIEELQAKKQAVADAIVGEGDVRDDMTWVNEIKVLMKLRESDREPTE